MFKGMSNIYKQAQKMQKDMQKVQNELSKLEIVLWFSTLLGGGLFLIKSDSKIAGKNKLTKMKCLIFMEWLLYW